MKQFRGKRVKKFIEDFEENTLEKVSMKLTSGSVEEREIALEIYRQGTIFSKIAEGYMRKDFKKKCKDKDWAAMKKYLLEEYPEIGDNIGKLETLTERNNNDILRYTNKFLDLVVLIEEEEGDDYNEKELTKMFLKGLPRRYCERVIEILNTEGKINFKPKQLNEAIKATKRVYSNGLSAKQVRKQTIIDSETSDDDTSGSDSKDGSEDSDDSSDDDYKKKIKEQKKIKKNRKDLKKDKNIKKGIDEDALVERFERLMLKKIGEIQQNSTRARKCFYCDKDDCEKSKCKELAEDIYKGLVKKNDKGYLIFPDGQDIPANYNRGGAMALVRKLKTRKISLDIDQDDWNYSISVDEFAARLTKLADSGLEDEALSAWEAYKLYQMKRKAEDAVIETVVKKPFRPWEMDDEALTNVTKVVEPKQKSKIVPNLGTPESKLDQMMDKILNASVSTTVEELMVIAPTVRKALDEKLKQKKLPVYGPTPVTKRVDFELKDKPETLGPCTGTIRETGRTAQIMGKVNGIVVGMEIDDGSNVSVMTIDFAKKIGASIEVIEGRSLGLVGNSRQDVLGRTVVDVKVGGLTAEIPFQVINSADFKILLGQNWLQALRVLTMRDENGTTGFMLHSRDGKTVEIVPVVERSGMKTQRIALYEGGSLVATVDEEHPFDYSMRRLKKKKGE